MLSGDLTTMSLADVLQWADATSASGTLVLERPTGTVWFRLQQRTLVAMRQPDVRSVALSQLDLENQPHPTDPLPQGIVAVEALYDEFLDSEATFRFESDFDAADDEVIELSLWIPEAVMEGMRHKDEWPDISALYPTDAAHMHRAEGPTPATFTVLQQAILHCAELGVSLADARLSLGLSRPGLLRGVENLRRLGLVIVDGAPVGGNLTDKLINQATLLLRERQFSEATHVFAALLSADPGSARIKALLREAEREQVAFLYERVPAEAVVQRTPRLQSIKNLSRSDREVIEHLNDRWDVSTVVLASRLREVETLKSLDKLHRMEAVSLVLR